MNKIIALIITSVIACAQVVAQESSDPLWTNAVAIKDVDTKPVPIEQKGPVVPGELAGLEATVHVGFVIDAKGSVQAEHIIRSTDDRFNEIAMSTVKTWRFNPAVNVGTAIPVRAIVPIRFK